MAEQRVHEKRYQVFISSTYQDLRDERRAVQDVVISMGDFPVQMESFPAADEDQFDFIRTLIDQCDYYILIIAGRYGTVNEDEMSYTHREFRYAVEKNVPVLVMLHGDLGAIPTADSEQTDLGRKRLAEFIAEAEYKRLRKTWTTLGDLKLAVREALDHAKATKPRIGWVRGDSLASVEALGELNEVRKENERFRDLFGSFSTDIPLPPLPAFNDTVLLDILGQRIIGNFDVKNGTSAKIEARWVDIFPIFYYDLDFSANEWNGDWYYHINHDHSCVAIGSAIAGKILDADASGLFRLSRGSFDRLVAYFVEAGLMLSGNGARSPFTDVADRVARRHQIAGSSAPFQVVAGQVAVSIDPNEIPF